MSRINTIYEALLNRKERVCNKSDIVEIVKEYNRTIGKINVKNAVWYLSRHNYIKRVMLQFYYINKVDERERNFCLYEDKELIFIVMDKLKLRWYLGLGSALYMLGKTWQTPNVITIINNRISGARRLLGLNVRFIKIKDSLIFGLKNGRTKNNISYYYSDLPKTYIDLAYLRESAKLTVEKKTKSYLKEYPKWLRQLI